MCGVILCVIRLSSFATRKLDVLKNRSFGIITLTGRTVSKTSSSLFLLNFKEILRIVVGQNFCLQYPSDIQRSSCPEVFLGKGVLKICSKFTGEHTCRSVILIKFQSSFIEITLRHWCFPVSLLHIFRTPFLKNSYGWLLLDIPFIPNCWKNCKIISIFARIREWYINFS